MRQALTRLAIKTSGIALSEITAPIAHWVTAQKIATGLLTVYCRHTSASLVIQENADPDVQADLATFFAKIAPEDAKAYRHDTEGPDDMPAHIRAALTQTSLGIPVEAGRLVLGTWQGIYLFEHRRAPQERQIVLHLIGED